MAYSAEPVQASSQGAFSSVSTLYVFAHDYLSQTLESYCMMCSEMNQATCFDFYGCKEDKKRFSTHVELFPLFQAYKAVVNDIRVFKLEIPLKNKG